MEDALINLIDDALRYESTDLFLIEDEPPRIRREGSVVQLHPVPVPKVAMEKLWARCSVDAERTKEADVSWETPSGGRLRVNLYRTLGRLAAVLRPVKREIPSLEELGLPAELLQSWFQRKNGLVLVTGPTGSGKSTTLASCLEWVNQRMCRHIVTLEDPIEFLFENENSIFSQREIRQDTESFGVALRSALRQSPDVLFIGEIRDRETAVTALQAAETGHLVVSTLHSASVTEAMGRFSNLLGGTASGTLALLAGQLIGIVTQKLLPKAGGGLFASLEYFQNEAGTRRWIIEQRMTDLQDYINKADGTVACSALDYLVASVNQGYLDEEVARGASTRPQDFDRAMRGIR